MFCKDPFLQRMSESGKRTFLGEALGTGELGRDGNEGKCDLANFSDKPHPCLSSSTGNSPSL